MMKSKKGDYYRRDAEGAKKTYSIFLFIPLFMAALWQQQATPSAVKDFNRLRTKEKEHEKNQSPRR
jgi:hypothetical protein